MSKLKDRIESYYQATDYKLLNRVPIIMCLNGKNFAKATQLLDKPYCQKLAECMVSTMLRLCTDIEGVLFGYHFNDEIILISRNDQNNETLPWYDNKLQKICSVISSIATLHLNKYINNISLNIMGDLLFTANIFMVPTIGEATNVIIYKQQHNFHSSIQLACFYHLLNKYDKNVIKEMLSGLSIDEKIDLLNQECGINYHDYPLAFRRGVASYRVPKVVEGEITKNKWHINQELPIFTNDQSFLNNIMKMGADIFRQDMFG